MTGLSNAEYEQLRHEGAFNNYAIQGLYTPGSTFKLVTATAELQTGIFPADKYVDDTGTFTVPGCEKAAAHAALRVPRRRQRRRGRGRPARPPSRSRRTTTSTTWATCSGPDGPVRRDPDPERGGASTDSPRRPNIDLPDEVEGRVDSPEVRKEPPRRRPGRLPERDVVHRRQHRDGLRPGHDCASRRSSMADAYATFANGGTHYAPEVAAGGRQPPRPGRHALQAARPRSREPAARACATRSSRVSRRGAADPSGTAYLPFHSTHQLLARRRFPSRARRAPRATRPGLEPNSWFVGFGPTSHPQYVVLCVIDEGWLRRRRVRARSWRRTFNYLVLHPVGALKLGSKCHRRDSHDRDTSAAGPTRRRHA